MEIQSKNGDSRVGDDCGLGVPERLPENMKNSQDMCIFMPEGIDSCVFGSPDSSPNQKKVEDEGFMELENFELDDMDFMMENFEDGMEKEAGLEPEVVNGDFGGSGNFGSFWQMRGAIGKESNRSNNLKSGKGLGSGFQRMGDFSKNHAEGSQRIRDSKKLVPLGGSRISILKDSSQRSITGGLQRGSTFQGSGQNIGGSNHMVTALIEPTNPMQAGDANLTTTSGSTRKTLMSNQCPPKGINGFNGSNRQIQLAPIKPIFEGSSRRILVMKSA
jgi:hypothetical protein